MTLEHSYILCRQHLHRYVRITTTESKIYDGFIADITRQNVTLAIPAFEVEGTNHHQFGLGPSRRLTLPLHLLASLFLLPFFGEGFSF